MWNLKFVQNSELVFRISFFVKSTINGLYFIANYGNLTR